MTDTGYWIEEGVFSSAECQEILLSLKKSQLRAGRRNLMSERAVASMAHDARLLQLAKRISGKSLLPFKATLFNKTSKANWLVAWHQDTTLPIGEFISGHGWSAPSRKAGRLFAQAPSAVLENILALRIHMDPSNESNGPLRVIPGSHLEGVLSDERANEIIARAEIVECVVGRGGVIAMSPLVVHASSKIVSDEPRRVIHIEYAESLELGDGIRLAIA